jgi:hypothetical protein
MRYANFKLAHYQMRAATWLMVAGIFSLVSEIDARTVHQTDIRGFGGGASFERGATICLKNFQQ